MYCALNILNTIKMTLFFIIVTISYLLLIICFIYGFDKVETFTLSQLHSKTQFSIIIPFRNEVKHLPKTLNTLKLLKYSKHLFEIIFVDDASYDNSVEIIKKTLKNSNLNYTIIANERATKAPKKDAITTGVKHAKFEWIITSDADCNFPKFWLNSFDEFIQNNTTHCIVAPVTYYTGHSFLSRFQQLDFMSLQGVTIGSFGIGTPFLCNGANFAYTKRLFIKLNGFKGNTHISSGDDIFFLEKVKKLHPKAIHYLKCDDAIVTTTPQSSWQKLIEQRIRWAAKTGSYNSVVGKFTGLIVLLVNFTLLVLPPLAIIGVFNIKIWVYLCIIKLHIDFLLLYKTSAFFNQRQAFKSFLISFLIYPMFCVYVAILSFFKGYQWKGRSFSK